MPDRRRHAPGGQTPVRRVLDAVDRSTADLPASRLALIRRHDLTASRYEWMFWDAAYTLESWPI